MFSPKNVVRLDGEKFLQAVRRAIRLECPHLHLTESLATELRLTTERLLGDHGVRAGRTSVDLVVDQMRKLEDVHNANGDRVVVRLAGAAIEERDLPVVLHHATVVAVARIGCLGLKVLEDRLDGRVLARAFFFIPVSTVENGRGDEC
jgi:hypothetical protein